MAASSRLRVAMVQFAPKLGEVHTNIAKARDLCRGLTPRSVDLVCFPEMIFSGYMFPDASSISPHLEHPLTGPTSTFCAQLARHLQCYVIVGFPERPHLPADPSDPSDLSTTTREGPASLIGANAALLFDTTGQLLHKYHKSNLFRTDISWARPGPGFTTIGLPLPFGRTALAICNDLSVSVQDGTTWQSIEHGPYELARYCEREGVRVLVLLNAWLKSEDGGEEDGTGQDDDDAGTKSYSEGISEDDGSGLEADWRVLNYWALRLRPLWANDEFTDEDERSSGMVSGARQLNDDNDLIVIISNRLGRERGNVFAGSSAMFSMCRRTGKPRLLCAMGQHEEVSVCGPQGLVHAYQLNSAHSDIN